MTIIQDGPVESGPLLCVDCQQEVESLNQDGRCTDCHNAPAVAARSLLCFCGIEIDRATAMCTERDCPFKR